MHQNAVQMFYSQIKQQMGLRMLVLLNFVCTK